jgi:hypothetical protein
VNAHCKRSVLVAIGLATLVAPASANSAVTIGSNLAGTPNSGLTCGGGGCTAAHRTLPPTSTAPDGLFAPIDGVVVGWRIKVGTQTTPVALRITRPGNSDTRTGAGTGPTVIPGVNAISTFEVQLPIQAGDAVGIDCCAGATLRAFVDPSVATYDSWLPRLSDGETRMRFNNFDNELLLNADIEPDCDSDGLGDETQDPSVLGGDCPLRGRNVSLDANKNKVKKGKKVTLSGRIVELSRQGECQSAQAVELQGKRPKATAFTTVQQLQSDAGGNFSTRRKVKKTFEYRAQVPETATCLGQASNTEKVKVKKPK